MKKLFTIYFLGLNLILVAQTQLQTNKSKFNIKKSSFTPMNVNGSNQTRENRAVFYTNDFSNPADWVMSNTSSPNNYDWEILNVFPNDLISEPTQTFGPNFNSTSGGNFAIVNSYGENINDNQNSNITLVNSIDCSLQTSVELSFDNYHKKYNDSHFVLVSIDGVNFTPFELNENYGVLSGNYINSPNAERVTVNISCIAANQPTVWIRFNYQGGDDWFWCIDDIELSDASSYSYDLQMKTPYFYNETRDIVFNVPLDYTIVPNNQIDNVFFKSGLENDGVYSATNAQLDISIVNSSSVNVFNGSSTIMDLDSCSATRVDSVMWSHSLTPETYTINYSADYDSVVNDVSPTNNSATKKIKVIQPNGSGLQWARDDNTENGNYYDLDANPYIMGNVFYVYNDITVHTIDVAFMGGALATDPGVYVSISLFEMDPGATSVADVFIPVFSGSENGIDCQVTASMIGNSTTTVWNKFPLNPAAPSTGVLLEGGKQYLAAVEHYGGTDHLSIATSGNTPNGDASVWLYGDGGSGVDWYYMTNKLKIRLGIDDNIWAGSCYFSVNEFELENLSLDQNIPNPSFNSTSINYSLKKSAEVTLEITDITGKIIYTEKIGNKGEGEYSLEVNTSHFASGIYYYSLIADSDKQTKKMIVSK
jgi:hypothetical protein